jgi:hypothetical protein
MNNKIKFKKRQTGSPGKGQIALLEQAVNSGVPIKFQ